MLLLIVGSRGFRNVFGVLISLTKCATLLEGHAEIFCLQR